MSLIERRKCLAIFHQFGIIANFDKQEAYIHYAPDHYKCIAVNDDMIEELKEQLAMMKTYFHTYNRPANGLAYWGITLIPPESLPLFLEIVLSNKNRRKSKEHTDLAIKILEAQETKKYMIHYGI